ncbi:tetratricopeptide repeat protein [Nocardiopsis sp. NPDC101807]|uniref:tetratricopeptide repeat protein n=1 Tax=Nocardiopsis sp. NPDC101807 TaxID=3364339 RepID=UPI0037F4F70E
MDFRGSTVSLVDDRSHGTAPSAVRDLPSPGQGFVGRAGEIRELMDAMAPAPAEAGPPHGRSVSVVTGMGGVGKTALALVAGHRALEAEMFSAVFFVDMRGYEDSPVTAFQALESLLRALGVAALHLPPDLAGRSRLYRSRVAELETERNSPVLVVADNVSSVGQVEPLIPGTSGSHLLVTTRDRLPIVARRLALGTLPPDTAVELLDNALRQIDPADDRITREPLVALDVVSACGGLPLALCICAGLLARDPDRTVEELSENMATPGGRLVHLDDGRVGIRHFFDMALARLTPFQTRVFTLIGVVRCGGITTEAVASLAQTGVRETLATLRELASAHLLSWRKQSRRWVMHDLLAVYASQRAKDASSPFDVYESVLIRLADHYVEYAGYACEHVREADAVPEGNAFSTREEAEQWLHEERANIITVARSAQEIGHDGAVVRLLALTADHLDRSRYFHDLRKMSVLAEHACRRLGDLGGRAAAWDARGVALAGLRDFRGAVELHTRAGDAFRDLGDRRREALARNNLGSARLGRGETGAAVEAHRLSLGLFAREGDRHGQAMALNNLAIVYQGERRFTLTIDCYTRARKLLARTGDRRREATVLNNLGAALQEIRCFPESLDVLTTARDIHFSFGDQHGEAGSWMNLGSTFFAMGKYPEAVDAWDRARKLYQSTNDLHGEARAWNNISAGHTMSRSYDEAVDAHTQAHHLYRHTGDRRGEGLAWMSLGFTQQRMGKFEEAARSHGHAREIFQRADDARGLAAVWAHLGVAVENMRGFTSRDARAPGRADQQGGQTGAPSAGRRPPSRSDTRHPGGEAGAYRGRRRRDQV